MTGRRITLTEVLAPTLPSADAEAMRTRARRARGGAVARQHGDALERWLDAQHTAARLAGLAHVRKVGAPVVVGRGGKPVAWAGTGPADYQGVLRGGRAVAIEAKSVDGRLSALAVADHQRADLDAVHALGGIALLVVEVRGVGVHAVPWAVVPWHVGRRAGAETRTVGAEELAPWRVAPQRIYLERWA